jgi:hypothetical protein
MCDKLIFDLAQEVEGSPNVFIRKDWLNILDNQNQNYNNNQSVVDTSQLSNSQKYMSYRESYFSIPFLVTLGQTGYSGAGLTAATGTGFFNPNSASKSADHVLGLKNWFGQIIHSFTLDYNGTTICQQTPFINMWNSFKLMTSLSLDDINTQGASIGFYPDDATSWQFVPATLGPTTAADIASSCLSGNGVCNNTDLLAFNTVAGAFNNFDSGKGNDGFLRRQNIINFDVDGIVGTTATGGVGASTKYLDLLKGGSGACDAVWKSYITQKVNTTHTATSTTITTNGYIQFSIMATVYLKHVHSFFNMCPLLKGVFMKMTMNLNNTTTGLSAVSIGGSSTACAPVSLLCTSVSNPLGGVNPLMVASGIASNGGVSLFTVTNGTAADESNILQYRMNISVGAICLDSQLVSTTAVGQGTLAKSIYLYIPAYTFNNPFETAYLASPIKQIKYTDVYQYQVLNTPADGLINNLLTNGIANVKSCLVLPFYSASPTTYVTTTVGSVALNSNTGFLNGAPVYQSPFDPAGTGPTSPMCWLTNFNIQVSGQNAIYNTQKYNFEQWNNQLYGQNAVNGGLTDGLTSGLLDRTKFDMNYNYYYVNVERMLPVEQSVPKSIQLLGQNKSNKAIDLICFIEYGVEINIDALTGARV